MENNDLKKNAENNFIQVLTEANEVTRDRVNAHDLLLRAIFDVLSDEQKTQIIASLQVKTSGLSSVDTSVVEPQLQMLYQLLPELLFRGRMN